jgi:hypothetical protein
MGLRHRQVESAHPPMRRNHTKAWMVAVRARTVSQSVSLSVLVLQCGGWWVKRQTGGWRVVARRRTEKGTGSYFLLQPFTFLACLLARVPSLGVEESEQQVYELVVCACVVGLGCLGWSFWCQGAKVGQAGQGRLVWWLAGWLACITATMNSENQHRQKPAPNRAVEFSLKFLPSFLSVQQLLHTRVLQLYFRKYTVCTPEGMCLRASASRLQRLQHCLPKAVYL